MARTETITWTHCDDAMPDAELNVLVFDAESMTVMEGFLDADGDGNPLWRDVTAVALNNVTHWAQMPAGPMA